MKVLVALITMFSGVTLSFSQDCPTTNAFPEPVISPDDLPDVEIPPDFHDVPFPFFHDFSWRVFVALNWPAAATSRGEPDRNRPFGSSADALVWETWKSDNDTFLLDGADPGPWERQANRHPENDVNFFQFRSKDDSKRANELAAHPDRIKVFMAPRDNPMTSTHIRHYNQGSFGDAVGSIVDQDSRYVRYEIRYNKIAYEHIRKKKLYRHENFPDTQVVFPEGSVIVKAAWRILEDSPNPEFPFYARPAILVAPDGQAHVETVGLVGLHIISKTASRPEWIWSSFEHIGNLSGRAPSFVTPGSTGPFNVLEDVVDELHRPKDSPMITQIKRLKPLHPCTIEANEGYHKLLGNTVWKNYQLVLTQWPTDPAKSKEEFITRLGKRYPTSAGTPFPSDRDDSSIANVVLETTGSFQTRVSCMNCHVVASSNRSEFVWSLGLRAHRSRVEELNLKTLTHWRAASLLENAAAEGEE